MADEIHLNNHITMTPTDEYLSQENDFMGLTESQFNRLKPYIRKLVKEAISEYSLGTIEKQ